MSLMHEVADRVRQQETGLGVENFDHLMALILLGQGSIASAKQFAATMRHPTPKAVADVLKDAVSVADLGEATGFASLRAAFMTSLAQSSAFDAMLSSFVRVDFNLRVLFASTAAVGSMVEEGAPKPVTRISLSSDGLERMKTTAVIVVSLDQLRQAIGGTMGMIGRELRIALSKATDEAFFGAIMPPDSPPATISSTGPLADLAAALDAVGSGVDSRLFLVAGTSAAKQMTTAAVTGSGPVFPNMTPSGGSISGVPVIVSSGIEPDSFMLVDASAFAVAAEPIRLDTAEHASIQMDDNPGAGPVELTSLWQTNCAALRAERWIGIKATRDDAVAVVEGVNY